MTIVTTELEPTKLVGPRGDLLARMEGIYPAGKALLADMRKRIGPEHPRLEIWAEQAMFLAYLVCTYNRPGGRILELGCARGFSAGLMKLAAPLAEVITVEPHQERRRNARANLEGMDIRVRPETSVALLELHLAEKRKTMYDVVFVDGDHKHIRLDLPWYNFVKVGGLFIHHDYSPESSDRPCPPVYEALNEFAEALAHPIDILMEDSSGVGMAAFIKRKGEKWPTASSTSEPASDSSMEESTTT